jgi:death-on-curing protein
LKKPYDIKRVIRLHNTIIEDTGGVQGVLDVGLLEEALFKPFMGLANGEELYPGIIKKAAILFEALINYHPFADGNKRTAEILTEIFLENSGYYWDFNEDEIVDFATEVANGKLSIKEIENWIANRIRKKTN